MKRLHNLCSALAILVLATAGKTSAQFDPTWTGAGPNAFWTTGANWDTGLVPPNNTFSYFYFGNASTYTVELNADWSVGALIFQGGGDYLLQSTLHTISFNTISISGGSSSSVTFDLDLIVNGNANYATISAGSSRSPIFNGGINNNGKDLIIGGNTNKTFNGVISGSGGLTSPGYHAATYRAANTFTGNVVIGRGNTYLTGDSGGFLGTTDILVSDEATGDRATLHVGSYLDPGTTASPDRINDAATVRLQHGRINFYGSDNTSTVTNETFDTLQLEGGSNIIALDTPFNTQTQVTVNNLVRNDHGTLWLQGSNIGQTGPNSKRLVIENAPALIGGAGAPGTTTISILPYVFAANSSSLPTLVTYGENGLRPLDVATEYASSLTADGDTHNVRLTANSTLTADKTVNALVLGSGVNSLAINPGHTLSISSGVILLSGISTSLSGGTIDFDSAEGIIATSQSNAAHTITSSITGSGGATYTTMETGGTNHHFTLSGSSSYTGQTQLNARVAVTDSHALGAAGPGNEVVIDYGGRLALLNNVDLQKDIIIRNVGNNSGGISSFNAILNSSGSNSIGHLVMDVTAEPWLSADARITAASGSHLTIKGSISRTSPASGSPTFLIAQDATIEVQGGFTGTSAININSQQPGTLILDGSTEAIGHISASSTIVLKSDITNTHNGGIAINNEGRLVGDVTIDRNFGYGVDIGYGATLAPGSTDDIGTMTIGSDGSANYLSLAGGSTAEFRVGLDSDQVRVFGNISFGNTVSLEIYEFAGAHTGTYSLFTYTGTLNNFANLNLVLLPDAWEASLFHNTTSKSVDLVVTAVPEPSTYALLSLGAAALAWQLRRRRTQ